MTRDSHTRLLAWLALAVGALQLPFSYHYFRDQSASAAPADSIDAHRLGALGNGLADDTAALQAANDAIEASGRPGVIVLRPGTFLVRQLTLGHHVSLQGAGVSLTRIKMKDGANSAAVLVSRDFAALAARSASGGMFRASIRDLTIDGNRARNSSGRGLVIYGKAFSLQNVAIESTAQDGLLTVYKGVDDFSKPAGTLEADFRHLSIQQTGGTGWVFDGPHDSVAQNIAIFSNAGWGWEVRRAIHATSVNTYLNDLGGIWAHGDGAAITGSGIIGSTAKGHGALLEAGGQVISSGLFSGRIGLELRGNHNMITCSIANTTESAFKLGAREASGSFNIVFGGHNTGHWMHVSKPAVPSVVIANSADTAGRLFEGRPRGTYIISGGTPYYAVNADGSGKNYVGGPVTLADVYASMAFRPPQPGGTAQDAIKLYGGSGPPNDAEGADNSVYFRADPQGEKTTIYRKAQGKWRGIL